jgi:phenylpropionate dioxygenase-like ring-hydroxylating dioxygenase large terminal subunit
VTGKKRYPFSAFPTGWFAVGFSSELERRQVLSRRYFGADLVLFRTASGKPALTSGFCPHLGADLAKLGRVDGEELRCGFHGFRFDGGGGCTGNAYGSKPPARARLRSWPVRERNGLVLAWHDEHGAPPAWEVPDLDQDRWTGLVHRELVVRTHPQETSENSVDFGHFTEVHGFRTAWITREVTTDGPVLRTSYGVDRKLDFVGMPDRTVRAFFDVEVHGLGFSLVQGRVPAVGIDMRHLVLSTPVDGERVHLRLATAIGKLGSRVITRLAHQAVAFALYHEVTRDAPVWESKLYVERPALAKGDGPIGVYRRWARQFYPEAPALAAE